MELIKRNKLLVGAALLALVVGYFLWSGKAFAGDWNGGYIGIGGSYGAITAEDTLGADAVGVSGIAGFDARIGRFVPGVFVEYGWKQGEWAPGFGGVDLDVKSWVAGGRLGVLITEGAMLFASLGYTQGTADLSAGGDEVSLDLSGYVVGGGAEINLDNGFFLRPEYRLTQYNEVEDEAIDASVHEGRLAVIYKLNWADPLSRSSAPLK
jgi:opacity protein-like surface antigen